MADVSEPLDALRLPAVPLQPRPAFTADLRRRMARQLGFDPTPEGAAVTTTEAPATGVTVAISAYLAVRRATEAIDWYVRVFGAERGDTIVDEQGRVGHAGLNIGGAHLMLSDEHPEMDVLGPESRGGSTVALHIVLPDVDAVVARAVEAGAFLERPVADQAYGERSGIIRDPFGHRWFVATPLEEVTHEELEVRIGDAFTVLRPGTPVGYFTIGTQDLARATQFYGPLFGWQVRPGGHIENVAAPHGGIEQGGPPAKLYFRVQDADAMAVRVRELGGTADDPTFSPSGKGIACRDDQGVPFDLWEPAPGY